MSTKHSLKSIQASTPKLNVKFICSRQMNRESSMKYFARRVVSLAGNGKQDNLETKSELFHGRQCVQIHALKTSHKKMTRLSYWLSNLGCTKWEWPFSVSLGLRSTSESTARLFWQPSTAHSMWFIMAPVERWQAVSHTKLWQVCRYLSILLCLLMRESLCASPQLKATCFKTLNKVRVLFSCANSD